MRKTLISVVRWALFGLFFLLGIIGLALPVVPQVPFFIAAFVVIAPESHWVRRKYFALRTRFPKPLQPIERWRTRRRIWRQEARSRISFVAPPPDPGDRSRPGDPDPRRSLEVR